MVREPVGGFSRPVFVDRSGRRRRAATLAGVPIRVGLLLSLMLLIAGLFGASPVPVPGLRGIDGGGQPVQIEQPGAAPSHGSPAAPRTRQETPVPSAAPTPTAGSATASVNPGGRPRGGPSRSHPGKPK